MIRLVLNGALRTAAISTSRFNNLNNVGQSWFRTWNRPSTLTISKTFLDSSPLKIIPKSLLQVPVAISPITATFVRPVTKFSLIKGKRKSVKAVIKRFKRLDWGAWIRTRSGRHKKIFKKSAALKRRLRQHIFTNSQQSWLLDKMVTKFWRRPKYYIDDPYTPYHTRDEFFASKGNTFKV